MSELSEHAAIFEDHRERLFGLAYRMLGTVQDAEDVVQEAYLRWHATSLSNLRTPDAWLLSVVGRIAIDRLRHAAVERAAYVGPWLAEPISTSPEERTALASHASLAFLWILERLGPEERAAFLLREVFDREYAEIAAVLNKSEAACRQIVHRAKARVRSEPPGASGSIHAQIRLLAAFHAALRAGDEQALLGLLAEEVELVSDGGGKVPASRHVLSGSRRIVHLLLTTERKWGHLDDRSTRMINGEPALSNERGGRVRSITALQTDGERILALYRVLNPDKLTSL